MIPKFALTGGPLIVGDQERVEDSNDVFGGSYELGDGSRACRAY